MLTGYGCEFESYLWRGNGVWTQLIGMWLLPFALALTYRAVHDRRYRIAAPVVLAATVCCHFITGYFALLCWGVGADRTARRTALVAGDRGRQRCGTDVGLGRCAAAFRLGLHGATRAMQNTYWMDSWGLGEAVTHARREPVRLRDRGRTLPDSHRACRYRPRVAVVRASIGPTPRALGLSAVALVLFAGRPTFGPVLNLLPGVRPAFAATSWRSTWRASC
jgi:hypothetical protein